MGDGDAGPLISSSAFVLAEPEFKIYDLKKETGLLGPKEFVLMTSDGFSNVHLTAANEKIYPSKFRCNEKDSAKSNISGALPGLKNKVICPNDPLEQFKQWQASDAIFSPDYDAAHEKFSAAVDEEARKAMFELVKSEVEHAEGNEMLAMENVLKKTLEIQEKSDFKWQDDVTLIVSIFGWKGCRSGLLIGCNRVQIYILTLIFNDINRKIFIVSFVGVNRWWKFTVNRTNRLLVLILISTVCVKRLLAALKHDDKILIIAIKNFSC